MNFDDQLKRAVDTLGDRLRDDISRELRLLTDDLAAAAQTDREAAASLAAEAATEKAEAAARARAEEAAIRAAEAPQAVPSRHAETDALVDDPQVVERLVNAIRAIDKAGSLSEVLDALVASASQEADRAGVLLLRGGRVRGWRFAGFPPAFDASAIDIALNDAGIIAIAVEQRRVASSDSDGPAPPFAELGDRADSTEAIAIPIVMAGEVAAVLYVDQQDAEPGILTLEPATLEVLARHTARALEALTAFKTARQLARADASSTVAGANNGGSRESAPDDEDEAARRYARLVISEIKLYHEDAVAEGRRDRNLAARLGGEIARARALYEQRVPAHLRGAAEHFHAELVRTLAGGDASLFEKAGLS
jgi:hypothetical protein